MNVGIRGLGIEEYRRGKRRDQYGKE